MAKNYACYLPQQEGTLTLASEPLGRGGEGAVYSVEEHSLGASLPPAGELVAKLYHDPQEGNRGPKIAAMIRHTPSSDSVAWPLAIVATPQGGFLGYLMKKLPSDTYRMWAEFANSKDRRKAAKSFDVRYALTASLNLALALQAVHASGHKVGDVNESNIFVGNDATVLLVDTDSAQVETPKAFYPCLVGKPEYTAPELSHGSLKKQKRTEESDIFAYSVAVYQLLVGGAHPTDAVFEGEDDPPSTVEKIRNGIYPNLRPQRRSSCKPVARIATQAIPSPLRDLLLRGLAVAPEERPTLEEFVTCLEGVLDHLVQCKKVKYHWYDSRDKRCGWCAHVKAGQPDPWAEVGRMPTQQKSLNPLKLQKEEKGATKAPRAQIGSTALQGKGTPPSPPGSTLPPPTSSKASRRGSSATVPAGNARAALANYPPISACYPSKQVVMAKTSKNVTLLDYNDGTTRPRPPLPQLAGSNFTLARQCLSNELPPFARLFWPFGKALPTSGGLLLGLLLGLALSFLWYRETPTLLQLCHVPATFPYSSEVFFYTSIVGACTSAGALLLRLLFTSRELSLLRNFIGTLAPFPQEQALKTALKMVVTPLIYGPLFVIAVVACLLLFMGQAVIRDLGRKS